MIHFSLSSQPPAWPFGTPFPPLFLLRALSVPFVLKNKNRLSALDPGLWVFCSAGKPSLFPNAKAQSLSFLLPPLHRQVYIYSLRREYIYTQSRIKRAFRRNRMDDLGNQPNSKSGTCFFTGGVPRFKTVRICTPRAVKGVKTALGG